VLKQAQYIACGFLAGYAWRLSFWGEIVKKSEIFFSGPGAMALAM
jgi:hypothetical protein